MNRARVLGLSLLLLTSLACLGQDCDSTIVDGAHVLGSGYSQVEKSSQGLINQGSDVRVRTFAALNGQSLDQVQSNLVKNCASWQGASGVTKNNLVTILLAPNDRKMGIFYGSSYHSALDAHHQRILHDYGAPKFRDKDWAGGISALENQLAARIAASRDEALHPAVNTTTVNEQATDLSGLWTFFKWLLFALIGGGICWAVIWGLQNRRKNLLELSTYRSAAAAVKARVASRLNDLRTRIAEAVANNDPNGKRAQVYYDSASTDFARLNESASYDPDTVGESTTFYANVRFAYERVDRALDTVEKVLAGGDLAKPQATPPKPRTSATYVPSHKHAPTPAATPEAPAKPAEATRTVEVHHYYDTPVVPTPVIIETPSESSYERRRREEREEEASSASSGSSSGWSRKDDDDSGSGTSSGWGSSDSGSGFSGGFGGSDSGGGSSDSF